MKRYLLLLIALSVGAFCLLSTISYLIDPYGIYQLKNDYFPRKVAAADKGRTVKPYQVLNTEPYTVLVGNSRVEIGMPAQHSFYQGKQVYNMGLPGANVAIQYAYALHAIDNSNSVQQVVIALDFLDFMSKADDIKMVVDKQSWIWRLALDRTEKSVSDYQKYFAERLSLLFSLSAITDIIITMTTQNNNINALNHFGFNDGNLYNFHVTAEGFGALYRQKSEELDNRLSKQELIFSDKSYELVELDNFIQQLKDNKIKIFLLINPYQQPYLDKIKQYDLSNQLTAWKQAMANVADKHELALYDFAINSELVTEVVPPTSHNPDDSAYFWEPAHYRPAFGKLILDTLLTGECLQLCRKLSN